MVVLILGLCLSLGAGGATPAYDLMLVLDLPASLYGHEAVERALRQFDESMGAGSHIGIVSATGANAEGIAALASIENSAAALPRLKAATAATAHKDLASGVERALYELRLAGRAQAPQAVVLISNGRIEIGDDTTNAQRVRWLAEALREDAMRRGVRLYAVAWSGNADIPLLHSLTAGTGGEYFRATRADDLPEALGRIAAALQANPGTGKGAAPVAAESPAAAMSDATPEPAPEAEKVAGWVLAGVVALGVLLSVISTAMVARRQRPAGKKAERDTGTAAPQAFLADMRGTTHISRYVLGAKPVMLGRTVGQDHEQYDYIIVGLPTVGRRHAVIEYRDEAFWILDQGSINGTYLNGVRVRSRERLYHGDRIRLHQCEFRFDLPGGEHEDRPALISSTEATVIASAPSMPPLSTAGGRDGLTIDLVTRVEAAATDKIRGASLASPAVPVAAHAASSGVPVLAPAAATGGLHERETMILQRTEPMTSAPSAAAVKQAGATPTQVPLTAGPPGAARPNENVSHNHDQGVSLEGFISTALLKTQAPSQRDEPEVPLPKIPPATPTASTSAAIEAGPASPYTVDELSIDDFLNEAQSAAALDDGALDTWAMLGPAAVAAARATTEPLEDKAGETPSDDRHLGDTMLLGEATIPPTNEK
ncbi:MAG: FHA domain-containing protein [Chromatiales bacterium]